MSGAWVDLPVDGLQVPERHEGPPASDKGVSAGTDSQGAVTAARASAKGGRGVLCPGSCSTEGECAVQTGAASADGDQAAAKMSHFPPSPAVLTSVLLTRPAYAQLQGQQFHAPRVFGAEWHPREEDKDELRWRDIGVKIATGFEIMMREGGRRGRTVEVGLASTRIQLNSQAASTDDAARSDPAYEKYLSTLTSAGFFGSEMPGSVKWKAREAQALQGWKSARAEDTTQQRPSFAYLVDKATEAAANVLIESLTAQTTDPEDGDSWLEVDPDELDGMVQRISGQAGKAPQQAPESGSVPPVELGEEHGQALQDLAKKVKDFVGGQGDVDGATFAEYVFRTVAVRSHC